MTRPLRAPANAREEALLSRHMILAEQLEEAHKYPFRDDYYIRRLKMMKLRVKDQMEILRKKSANSA